MTGVQIVKTKAGKYRVKYYGKNGEQLAVSEVLNTRQSCNKNIKAMENIFSTQFVLTGKDIVSAISIQKESNTRLV